MLLSIINLGDHENPSPQTTTKSTKSSTHTSHSSQKAHKVTTEESQTTAEHKTSWQGIHTHIFT